MDAQTFDRLVAAAARRPTRRNVLRLLSVVLAGALLPARRARAQDDRPDSDGDGLFDDDETNVYGTRPDVADTDGDTVDDGQEIFNRDNGLGGNTNPLVNENAPPPADPAPPAATCLALGAACSGLDLGCCQNAAQSVQCCTTDWNGASACTDLVDRFTCPDPAVPATGCPVGMTNCGGFCTDLSTDHGNCGACGNRCSQIGPDYNCRTGTCTRTCPAGLDDCFGRCVDLMNDVDNCGGCGDPCRQPGEDELIACRNGACEGYVR